MEKSAKVPRFRHMTNFKQNKKATSATVSLLKRVINILEEAKQPLLMSEIYKELNIRMGIREGLHFLLRYKIVKREYIHYTRKYKAGVRATSRAWHYSIN
jgi:hypothetical protein